jgi:hypothetical protein
VPLHCMPVEFDRVKHDLVLAAPRFEAVSVHKFVWPWEYAPRARPTRPGAAKGPHVCEC